MAGFIRSKQVGIQKNLSAGISSDFLAPDDLARFGINSQIGCLAYDPVQSLLAIGTKESKYGSGQIYVFGQQRVQVTFNLSRQGSIQLIRFCANRLISLSSKNELTVWDLITKKKLTSTSPPGITTAIETDPTLDWAFVGFQNGRILVYDLDRLLWAPLKLPNFWYEKTKKSIASPVVSMQLHPKDIGQLLIGYSDGAVIYSFKLNSPTKFFEYTEPSHSSETSNDIIESVKLRKPRLTHAIWHPSGTFVGTAYDDSVLNFWDSKDGRILRSRTITDSHIDKHKICLASDSMIPKESFYKISWCCKENTDDTSILVAGGSSPKELSLLELGVSPVYATATWQNLTDYFEGKSKIVLPTPQNSEVVDFCLIPKSSPHFAGAHDPIALIALLSSGELVTLSYPDGYLISPNSQLHPSISFVHPFVTSVEVCNISRLRWLSMTEKRLQGPLFVTGGIESQKPLKCSVDRNIILAAHGDGIIRLWDSGQVDLVENSQILQVDMARALEKKNGINITALSMGSHTGELAVGNDTGQVVIYKWGKNRLYGRESTERVQTIIGEVVDISSRSEPTLDEGLQPRYLYDMAQGPITVLKTSNIGFLAIGAESGGVSIIDLRGPTIILNLNLNELTKLDKRSSFLKVKSGNSPTIHDWPVVIEFGILTLDSDNYSSITCFVGTFHGNLMTFKIFPDKNRAYTAQYAGSSKLSDKIISITPIINDSGELAEATGDTMRELGSNKQTHGLLVAVSQTEVRIFKPATAKGAHKSFDGFFCETANVIAIEDRGYALVGIFGDATVRVFSIPGLKEINSAKITAFDVSRISASVLTKGGSIFGWTGPSELAVMRVWGSSQPLLSSGDRLINTQTSIPSRPTISSLEWIRGTQFLSPNDLDLLIGGPDRLTSMQIRGAQTEAGQTRNNGSNEAHSSESWGDYMARQLNERTEKLDLVGDSINKIQESSQSWANDVSKFVKKQKRGMILNAVTGKFS
ncbi:Lethal giant larvae protein-like protein SRO77 [Erysiphe neolycopersici]|uniref:Lethal giant larvae protein-like protein SRO77 n=1 Tax=Erysiphe neolycopersici TaxID=212602 RepID=A0A420HR03_9PEZI|nr:Lethal giant larvae protein-like protein SRO77 [Erysiphe neolycopersici]